jgi:hypothetical protein
VQVTVRAGSSRELDDGNVTPLPPMLRAIDTVKAALEKDPRFEVVEYTQYNTEEGVALAVRNGSPLIAIAERRLVALALLYGRRRGSAQRGR